MERQHGNRLCDETGNVQGGSDCRNTLIPLAASQDDGSDREEGREISKEIEHALKGKTAGSGLPFMFANKLVDGLILKKEGIIGGDIMDVDLRPKHMAAEMNRARHKSTKPNVIDDGSLIIGSING